MVVGTAEDVAAEREESYRTQGLRHLYLLPLRLTTLLLPLLILISLGKIFWGVGMGKPHTRKFNRCSYLQLGHAAILAHDQLEHGCRIRNVAVVPVGGHVGPVTEVI